MSRNDFRYSSLCSCGLSSWAQRLRTCSGVRTGGVERLQQRQRAGCCGSSTRARPPRWSLHRQMQHTGAGAQKCGGSGLCSQQRRWFGLEQAAGAARVLCGPVFRAGGGHSATKRCVAASTIRGFFSRTERKVQYRGSEICSSCVEYDSARGCSGKQRWWKAWGLGRRGRGQRWRNAAAIVAQRRIAP